MQRRLSLRVSLIILVSVAVVTVCVAITAITFRMSSNTARKAASTAFSDVVMQTHGQIDALMSSTLTIAELGASLRDVGRPPSRDALEHPAFVTMSRMLRVDASVYSVFVGRADGGFFQLIALRGEARIAERLRAPAGTAFVGRTISVENGVRRQDWVYLKDTGGVVARRVAAEVDYDPRERPWFQDAVMGHGAVLSRAYVFNSSMTLGMTASRVIPGGGAVFGVDVTLSGLSRYISSLKVSPNARIYVFDDGLSLLAASDPIARHADGLAGSDPGRAQLTRMLREGKTEAPVFVAGDDKRRIAATSTWIGPE
ncbi:MAG: cache domain-containing protein, partial [Rhodospirillaceae bacterium]|nr:cache domain-containing protein [Rhodospirillaceae bacterium]